MTSCVPPTTGPSSSPGHKRRITLSAAEGFASLTQASKESMKALTAIISSQGFVDALKAISDSLVYVGFMAKAAFSIMKEFLLASALVAGGYAIAASIAAINAAALLSAGSMALLNKEALMFVTGAALAKLETLGAGAKGGLIGLALWGGWEIGQFLNNNTQIQKSVAAILDPVFRFFDRSDGAMLDKLGERLAQLRSVMSQASVPNFEKTNAGQIRLAEIANTERQIAEIRKRMGLDAQGQQPAAGSGAASNGLSLNVGILEQAAMTAVDEQIAAAQTAAQTAKQSADSYRQIGVALSDAVTKIKGNSTAGAGNRLDTLFGVAMTGNAAALSGLPKAADDFLAASLASSRTASDYARAQAKVLAMLDQAGGASAAMVSWQELSATLWQTQLTVLENIKTELGSASPDTAILNEQAGLLRDIHTAMLGLTAQTIQGNTFVLDQTGSIIAVNTTQRDQTGKVIAGNALIDTQTSQIITGNATQDAIKAISSQNAAYSEGMLKALVTGSSGQTSRLDGIYAGVDSMVVLLKQWIALMDQQTALAQAAATKAAADQAAAIAAQAAAAQAAAQLAATQLAAAQAAAKADAEKAALEVAAAKAAAAAAAAQLAAADAAAAAAKAAADAAAQAIIDLAAAKQAVADTNAAATDAANRLMVRMYADANALGIGYLALESRQAQWDSMLGATEASVLRNLRNEFDTASAQWSIASSVYAAMPGHALGLAYVPRDDYAMRAHRGEAVIDAGTMAALRGYGIPVNSGGAANDDLLTEMKELRKENAGIRSELAAMRKDTRRTADTLVRVTRDGESMLTAVA